MRVLVTGATGFVGRSLCELLAANEYSVRAAVRAGAAAIPDVADVVQIGDLSGPVDWRRLLGDVDCVLHLAGRAHNLSPSDDDTRLHMATNAEATRRLAEASARFSVRRFVYLSSIKVNGEGSTKPYLPSDTPEPKDAYGTSKLLAERHLLNAAAGSGMRAVIVRSPMVYGPNVRGNFLRLLRLVDRGVPFPIAKIRNRRSMVSVWNLSDLLVRAIEAALQSDVVLMVSDGEDLSTGQLIERLAQAMDRRARLFGVPESLLRACFGLLGKAAEIDRLCGSLTVDIQETMDVIGWRPVIGIDEGLRRTAAWYISQRSA